jgi:peptidyl-prolyl cis-trans isomerase SurA
MKKIIYILLLIFNFTALYGIESKIIYKIENEIITNIDIKNEFKYLSALNNKLLDLSKEKIFSISKDSIIREKIKKIEILKNFKSLEIKREYLNIILQNTYERLNLQSLEEFEKYLKNYNLELDDIEKKMVIDALWNELIIKKYNSKINIDVEKIKNEITKNSLEITKVYLLSEIVFEIKNKKEIEPQYNLIKQNINEIGFENTSSIFSISESSKVGGDIGWISEQSLNRKIRENFLFLNKGDISKPFIVPGGVLILMIRDIKEKSEKINEELELKKRFAYQRNQQLNQYSKIYFNKIKKNFEFNE